MTQKTPRASVAVMCLVRVAVMCLVRVVGMRLIRVVVIRLVRVVFTWLIRIAVCCCRSGLALPNRRYINCCSRLVSVIAADVTI